MTTLLPSFSEVGLTIHERRPMTKALALEATLMILGLFAVLVAVTL